MNKKTVCQTIAKGTGISIIDTEQVVDAFLTTVENILASGAKLEIRGFGTFRTRQGKARVGRNPQTGASVQIPAKIVPGLKFSKDLRARLNQKEAAQ